MKILRELCYSTSASLIAFSYRALRGQYPHHYHPEVELILMTAGCGRRMIGDHLGNYAPGDLTLIGPNVPHSYSPSGAALVLQFDAKFGGGILQSLPEFLPVRMLLDRAQRGLNFPARTSRRVAPLFKELIKTRGPRQIALFIEILGLLSADSSAEPLAGTSGTTETENRHFERIGRVCAWINQSLQEPITLKEAAAQARMAPSSFSRLFHRVTKTPFVRYVNDARVGHASRLLLDTDKSITEIAFASGFSNLSNFHRRFRELRAMTPRTYRIKTMEMEREKFITPRANGRESVLV